MDKESASTASPTPPPQQNRKQRRAMESKQRSVRGGQGVKTTGEKGPELSEIITGIKQTTEGLRQAFNKNHLAYSQALGAFDGHISVIRAVLNDLNRQQVQVDAEGSVDWTVYYGWYNQHVKDEAAKAAEKNKDEGTKLITTEEAEEELFGGNYGSRF